MKSIPVAVAVALALLMTLWCCVIPRLPIALPLAASLVPPLVPTLPARAAAPAPASANDPRAGSVALIKAGDGSSHIAIVEAVSATSLTIIEGNNRTGAMTRRSATGADLADAERQLQIVGYYTP